MKKTSNSKGNNRKEKVELESKSLSGISPDYNRNKFDNQYAHKKYKEKVFSNKNGEINKTALDENGKRVYLKKKDAKNRYGDKIGEKSVGEADHIDSLKAIYERHKNNPFLTNKDIKEVANRTTDNHENFQLIKASDNRSKQHKSDIEIGFKEGNIKKVFKGAKAQVETDVWLTQKTVNNIGNKVKDTVNDAVNNVENTFNEALENSVIPLMIVGTQDLVKVAQGEMTMKEAIDDVGITGLKIAATGVSLRVASYALSGVIEQSGNSMLQTIAKTNQIGTIIVAGTIVARATSKYISGEIDGKQFFEEISEEGLSLVAGIVGGAVVGPLGTIIASMACSIMVSSIKTLKKNYKSISEIDKQYLAILDRVSNKMLAEISRTRELLKKTFETEKKNWNNSIDKGFDSILCGTIHNNMGEISEGLNIIMNLFGSNVKFKNCNDVRNFMNSRNRLFEL